MAPGVEYGLVTHYAHPSISFSLCVVRKNMYLYTQHPITLQTW